MGVPFGFTGAGNMPGMNTAVDGIENKFTWGPEILQVATNGAIDGASRDAGSTPTTLLREGLLLGKVTDGGLLKQYSATATDGTEVVWGILGQSVRVTDIDGDNNAKFVPIIVGGLVKAAQLYGLDARARSQMSGNFVFDDDPAGHSNQIRRVIAKTANYTLTAADRGTRFTTQGASGAVTFTVPTPDATYSGFILEFANEVDQNMTVACATAKLVTFNNAAATSVAFSTAGNKIGGLVRLTPNADFSKWIVEVPNANTVTVA